MNNPIYKPKGAAKEYGDYALNIYTGCPHGCTYCYGPGVLRKSREDFHSNISPREGIVEATRKQLKKWKESGITGKLIHLCFTCDPFPLGYSHKPTIDIIKAIKGSGNHVQLLTKNYAALENPEGNIASSNFLKVMDLLDENDWYGITYDGTGGIYGDVSVAAVEASTVLTYASMKTNTWVSFEPVIDADEVLRFIRTNHENIEKAKIGKLNYHHSDIDWKAFGDETEALCKELKLEYYIKDSLRAEMEK